MYPGKGVAVANTATGVAVLPNTGDNRALFVIAACLLVSGVAIFVVATLAARKQSRVEAN